MTPIAPPTGARYWLGTWSGRLILLNAIVFIVLSLKSGSLFMPDTESLLAFGAKDAVSLAHGEWWRFVTPMFIHIGIVHFAVNSYMLYVIGYQLERLLGGGWFLLVYLAAGLGGNIASSVFSMAMSAGASGALFGLLGAGLYLERSIGRRIMEITGQRPRNRAYFLTVVINLAFGFLVPFIDNSAHLGGLVTGGLLTFAMVSLRPNTLRTPSRKVGVTVIALLVAAAAVGAYFGTNPTYLGSRAERAAVNAGEPAERVFHYDQAIAIRPDRADLRLDRARVYFFAGEVNHGYHDVRGAIDAGATPEQLTRLSEDLAARGMITEAWQIQRMSGR